jgi:uncharacterized membrane protein YgdD (TMEM256/DUF423 family)
MTGAPPPRSAATARLRASCLRAAGVLGMTGVLLGAFGAHALRARLSPDLLDIYKTGVSYHLMHALALLGVANLVDRLRWPRLTRGLFVAGILVFSGSLYLLALSGVRWLGAVTPLGGLCLIAAWATLVVVPARSAD